MVAEGYQREQKKQSRGEAGRRRRAAAPRRRAAAPRRWERDAPTCWNKCSWAEKWQKTVTPAEERSVSTGRSQSVWPGMATPTLGPSARLLPQAGPCPGRAVVLAFQVAHLRGCSSWRDLRWPWTLCCGRGPLSQASCCVPKRPHEGKTWLVRLKKKSAKKCGRAGRPSQPGARTACTRLSCLEDFAWSEEFLPDAAPTLLSNLRVCGSRPLGWACCLLVGPWWLPCPTASRRMNPRRPCPARPSKGPPGSRRQPSKICMGMKGLTLMQKEEMLSYQEIRLSPSHPPAPPLPQPAQTCKSICGGCTAAAAAAAGNVCHGLNQEPQAHQPHRQAPLLPPRAAP